MSFVKEGTVQKRGQSKAGKPTITIDGQLYYAGKTDLGGLVPGDRLSYSATEFGERGGLWSIDKGWKLLEGASKYPSATQPSNGIAAPAPSPSAPVSISAPVLDAERPCISNWGAEAIKAGLVKNPGDMLDFVKCWKEALRADTSGSSDIP